MIHARRGRRTIFTSLACAAALCAATLAAPRAAEAQSCPSDAPNYCSTGNFCCGSQYSTCCSNESCGCCGADANCCDDDGCCAACGTSQPPPNNSSSGGAPCDDNAACAGATCDTTGSGSCQLQGCVSADGQTCFYTLGGSTVCSASCSDVSDCENQAASALSSCENGGGSCAFTPSSLARPALTGLSLLGLALGLMMRRRRRGE